MLRRTMAVIGGLLGWIVVASIGDRLLRFGWPAYAAARPSMSFTLGMMGARLLLGGVSTLAGGLIAGVISDRNRGAVLVTGGLLLLFFAPLHISIWTKFPVWYHLIFLGTLVPLTLIGANLRSKNLQEQ